MTRKYYTFNKIIGNTLAIKQGDKGVVWSLLVNALYYIEKKQEVRHHGSQDMGLCVLDRKCCVHAPYI
jgi:hypothetical protein